MPPDLPTMTGLCSYYSYGLDSYGSYGPDIPTMTGLYSYGPDLPAVTGLYSYGPDLPAVTGRMLNERHEPSYRLS